MRKDNLYYDIYNTLRDDILSGKITPSEKITEIGLAKKLNVSRTPIRLAITKLREEGLIKGNYVYIPNETDFRDIFQVRGLLEGFAAEYCATYITEESLLKLEECVKNGFSDDEHIRLESNYLFHQILVEETHNKKLIQIIDQMQSLIRLFRITVTLQKRPRLVSEHEEIYQAIKEGNGSRAKKLIQEHIDKDLNFGLSHLSFISHKND
ncbi:GntR family transcriptional regulator [Ligilactobacillus salivarius]|uniref:Transcriptional regulator, GntR family n=1 Tax=Ligilactobacillus salivarius NIAS840 TaxID=1029822 RepID=F5VGD9_9LACO|nr:GntR family transcriptional regulator [Ligilactobacillus salivarius]PEG96035.1 GntR family transcriptional regulator [Lactobacillus sp. UMNPBX9]PEH09229.1 GntR family transcriptional regulator [Lactobacillus sp. UMNPBX2]EGL98110.1 transcriptional regulator, GntR family [Ligilactobacillus salivarius NIAS840]MBE5067297.1 GntR family transcriptional regulator [Ligilactobacillus salivarius]MDM8223871.1 GntR family transcriptional regulator [Ligilactobacillus salivarius]